MVIFVKTLFKLGKMTLPNCIYRDASIDDVEYSFFHCERCSLETRNLEAKVGACAIENFCNVILSSEKNWNSMANYIEALLISKKFGLDERSRMDVSTAYQILLRNPDMDMDMNGPNGQMDSNSN